MKKTVFKIAAITDEFGVDFMSACQISAELGIHNCELRNIDLKRIDESVEPLEIQRIRQILRSNEITVESISPGLFKNSWTSELQPCFDINRLGHLGDIANKLGCSQIITFGFRVNKAAQSPPTSWLIDHFGEVALRSEQLGVTVLLENHSGCAVATTDDLSVILGAIGSRHLGAVWDPANHFLRTRSTTEIFRGFDTLRGYIKAVHVKDIDMNGFGCDLGTGAVDWPNIFRLLNLAEFSGRLTLEPHRKGMRLSVATDLGRLIAMTALQESIPQ